MIHHLDDTVSMRVAILLIGGASLLLYLGMWEIVEMVLS